MSDLEGIVNPAIDVLLEKVDSKYELVIASAKRARQINDYFEDYNAGQKFRYMAPVVDSDVIDPKEKPLSAALHEIAGGMVYSKILTDEQVAHELFEAKKLLEDEIKREASLKLDSKLDSLSPKTFDDEI